ncbi:MAG TPA: AAA family ATPase [Peptococcaceae bacterium]|nr:AAA family ATPase [Peptococcaceae bacterium]
MKSSNLEQYIRYIELDRDNVPSFSEYPFNLPAIRELRSLSFHPKVTFIIGENGSGKSTVLEAIAVAYGFNAEGGTKNFNFTSRATQTDLHNYLRVVKGTKMPRNGFFLRAESFYNFASNVDDLDREMPFGPPLIETYVGRSLHEQSHGESFFAVFLNKFSGSIRNFMDWNPWRRLKQIRFAFRQIYGHHPAGHGKSRTFGTGGY